MKRNLLLITVLFTVSSLFAQTGVGLNSIGLVAGGNISKMNFAKGVPPPPTPMPTSFKAGLRVGFYTDVRLVDRLSIRNEYVFSQVSNEVESTKEQYTLNYVSLPVLAEYQASEKLFFLAGPELGFLINAKRKMGSATDNITHDTEERSIGIVGGIGYAVTSSVALHARYQMGMNHIGIGQRSDVTEFKLEQFQMLLQIGF
jgi:hypothetical protein